MAFGSHETSNVRPSGVEESGVAPAVDAWSADPQFLIVTAGACPWLDGKHTVFGRVTSGMDIVDTIS